MNSLESILEISLAISNQKAGRQEPLLRVVENLFKIEERFAGFNAGTKGWKQDKDNFMPEPENLPVNQENNGYSHFKMISGYISEFKGRLYRYYNSAKKSVKKAAKSMGYKILSEIEDWGVIFFKPTFMKMIRLTQTGLMYRYQQKLWLYVSKK